MPETLERARSTLFKMTLGYGCPDRRETKLMEIEKRLKFISQLVFRPLTEEANANLALSIELSIGNSLF